MKTYSNSEKNAERWEKVAAHSDHDKQQRRATHVMAVPGGLLYQVTLEQGQHAPAIALAFVPVGDEVTFGDKTPVGSVAESRPPGRDSFRPAGASLVSTISAAPSGDI